MRGLKVPMAALWCVAFLMVTAYYAFQPFAAFLEPLARFQTQSGWFAAFLNRVCFCGLLPGVFLVTVKTIRPRRPLMTVLMQTLWCGLWGVVCAWFYGFQVLLFGDGADFATLFLKTAVNQFVWTPLCIAPVNAVFFFWLGRDCSWARLRREWPRNFLRDAYLPNLLANWCVWVPVFFAIYAFPFPLQVQLTGIIGCFWSLLCIRVGVLSRDRSQGHFR